MRGADGLFDCFAEFGAGAKLDDVFGRYPDRGSVARVPSGSCMFPLYCEGAESGQGDFFAADERGGCYFMKASRLLFASPLDIPASEEMDSINCVLFILSRSCDGDTDGSAGRGHVAARSTK